MIVLSGILTTQAPSVLAAFRAQGFAAAARSGARAGRPW